MVFPVLLARASESQTTNLGPEKNNRYITTTAINLTPCIRHNHDRHHAKLLPNK